GELLTDFQGSRLFSSALARLRRWTRVGTARTAGQGSGFRSAVRSGEPKTSSAGPQQLSLLASTDRAPGRPRKSLGFPQRVESALILEPGPAAILRARLRGLIRGQPRKLPLRLGATA